MYNKRCNIKFNFLKYVDESNVYFFMGKKARQSAKMNMIIFFFPLQL